MCVRRSRRAAHSPCPGPVPARPRTPPHAAGGGGPARQHCGRAPPSLAELQLLRI
ncbi:DUF6153 family protein [Streptomyces sp. MOE7]|uniref:DUF6153 family protein n=1 Tax=Streptomyces sp. MOE7 TaxID=1961713 RepID=UPI0030154C31